ncbi:MAG: hypothetical protein IKA47_12730 [Oscillospiraceae bacterium]|nr:hypothetical protein [Oscillospiraceae bacterium]
MELFKRTLALILLFALIVSAAPITVRADDLSGETGVGSRFPEEEQTPPDDTPYYGRAVLESMGKEALLYAYDQIVTGVENTQETISVYDGKNPITQEEVKLVMSVYRRDYAHHFWLGNGYSISYNSMSVTAVVPQYLMTGAVLMTAKARFEAAAKQILSGITEGMTEYEKELYLHDTLAQRIVYKESTNAHNAYGALVEGIAVCEGYAEAFQYLLHQAGIWSYLVIGSSRGVGHEWNMVRIDGKYYHVDLTWDDQDTCTYHAYFNVTDEMIRRDHSIDATSYELPACTATDAFYFTGKDTYLETYTAETVGNLLRDNDLRIHVYIPGDLSAALSWYGENVLDIAGFAGINGGFSYGYSYMGNEAVFYIKGMGVKVTDSTDISYYRTLATALNYCADGSKLRLVGDLTENMETGYALELDLNGYDIAGNLTAPNTTVYDSQTADYTVNNGNGYGVITGTVKVSAPAEGYIQVAEEDGTSYHKVDLALDKLVLKADSAGLYYTGSFLYDEVVAENALAYGVTLSTQNEKPVADDTDAGSLYTTSGNSVLVKDVISEENTAEQNIRNAKQKVYARAYLKLSEGEILYSDANATNLQAMVETVDAVAWDRLSNAQKAALTVMYQTYAEEMATWNIPNLKSA